MAPPPTLIFLHIPKTAGSTLHSILDGRFAAHESMGVFSARFAHEQVARLAALDEAKKNSIRLLRGHQPFGLHRVFSQPCVYLTVLREPIARVTSQYYYILKNQHNPLHEQVRRMSSPAEFVASGISLGMNNGQVRWLLGEIDLVPFGELTQAHLEQVKTNIEKHFAWVGLTERFDESVMLLQRVLGWKVPPFYRKQNVNPSKQALRDSQLEAVSRHNQLDIALYEFATGLLEQRLAEALLGPNELRRFRVMNFAYSRLRWPQDFLPRAVRTLRKPSS